MLPSPLVRAVRSLRAVASCTVVLLAPAPAASATTDAACRTGGHSTPGSALPCQSAAPGKDAERLGRKL